MIEVATSPRFFHGIKSLEPGKAIAELQSEPGLTHVITLASYESSPGASPRALT